MNDFVKESLAKRDELINRKLKQIAKESKVDLKELQQKFDTMVKSKINELNQSNDDVLRTITSYKSELLNGGIQSFWDQLLDGLAPYKQNLHESPAFQLIKQVDERFAQALSNVIVTKPSAVSVQNLRDAFDNGAISKISQTQYDEILESLNQSRLIAEMNAELAQVNDDVDGDMVMSTIFASLNMYDDITKSPLYVLIKEIDEAFSKMLLDYTKIDVENDELLQKDISKIQEYCADKESLIYKAFTDVQNSNFEKVKSILELPLPIDLTEIYEIFEIYPDYFQSDVFKLIQEIDAEFGALLNKLETVPEGEELDKVNEQVDAHLSNKSSPIYIAMNDINSENFTKLKETIDQEWEKYENTVTTDKIVDYVSQMGVESDGFKLVQKIDPQFADILTKMVSEVENDKIMEHYNTLEQYLDQPNEILHALNDKEGLNYKLLKDIILPSEEASLEEAAKIDNENLPEDVKQVNKMYELTSKIIDELKSELENNTFVQPNKTIEASMDKLLGFQPTPEQLDSSLNLKEKPLPKHHDEVLELCVNIIMKDGKKEVARKNLNRTLYLLFLETRQNPIQLLKNALDLVAPLVITKTVKTGFAKNFTVPAPLTQRQRDRMALLWILDSCDSKASNDFPVRLCEEILFVLSGKSKLMDKRVLSHKMAIANRSYLKI